MQANICQINNQFSREYQFKNGKFFNRENTNEITYSLIQ